MSVGFIRFAKAANLVTAVCLFAFGITVIVMPSLDISVIRIVSEALLILFGIFKMAGYFSKDLYRLAFQYDLPLGILFIIIGTVMLIRSWLETDIICTLFGSALIIDSIFKSYNIEGRKEIRAEVMGVAADTGITGVCGGHIAFIPTDGK